MIRIEALGIALGRFELSEVDLSIEKGEYAVLLGPTGGGKTVLLECVVGIHRPRNGRILIDGREITALEPEEREIGYVPQDYALFPNMTVASNVAYGLEARRVPRREIERRVGEMLDRLGIGHLAHRSPMHLSGGEKQRVALGRALVTEPRVLLLDEPLSALDEDRRTDIAQWLKTLQRTIGATFLHVCHDFEEAAEVADRVAILQSQRIVQVGTIEEVLDHPATLEVARFTRSRNILNGVASASSGAHLVSLPDGTVFRTHPPSPEGPVSVVIRPENVRIVSLDAPLEPGTLAGTVRRIRRRPTHLEMEIDVGVTLVVYAPRQVGWDDLQIGERVGVSVPPSAVKVFPLKTDRRQG